MITSLRLLSFFVLLSEVYADITTVSYATHPEEAYAENDSVRYSSPPAEDISVKATGYGRKKRQDVTLANETTSLMDGFGIEGQTEIYAPGYIVNEGPKPNPATALPDEIYDTEVNGQQSRKKRQTSCNGKYTQTDRDAILKYHNDMRSTIARGRYVARGITKPPAVNMRKLYWSCLLENSAQQVANTCVFEHSNRKGKNLGENLYRYRIQKRWYPNPLPIQGTGYNACRAWEAEFPTIGWPSNFLSQSSFDTGIGHATQMAWWHTSMLGCGVAQCSDSTYQKILVVCHYRDTGNWINENVYDSGTTCSNCGSGYRCEPSSGLCSV